jgi:hypothetical protein
MGPWWNCARRWRLDVQPVGRQMGMFSVEDRERVSNWVRELAESDARIVAGAVVGSLAHSAGDRWSDIDLTFAVADHVAVVEVLEDWTRRFIAAFDAAHLFDLPHEASIYRVFLLPNNLQVDLSFTPASRFGAKGPRFRLIFGHANDMPYTPSVSPDELCGHAVHHALRARFCIERKRYWHAEYWISSTRNCALSLACLRLGFPTAYGRGYDDLPAEVHGRFSGSFVVALERGELLRALGVVIEGLVHESVNMAPLAAKIEPQLRLLTTVWDDEP